MREVIDLFRDQGTVDELGIGSIRDTFSDLLFPGLSTVQTRAKYFLLVPWVYLRVERERVPASRAAAVARRYQTDLIEALKRGGSQPAEGVIGWDAGANLQRLPASVYWSGLHTFGIRLFNGSVEEYHRSLDGYQRRLRDHVRGEGEELADRLEPNWTYETPEPPRDLWNETTLDFASHEAAFMADQIAIYTRGSLLAELIQAPAKELPEAPWLHPALEGVRDRTKVWLHHAEMFSHVMHGAALVYNLMLSERAAQVGLTIGDGELVDRYRQALERWSEELLTDWATISTWDQDDFWAVVLDANPRIPFLTQRFVREWISFATTQPHDLVGLPDARALIAEREARLKRGRARLTNHRALEMWNGASGTTRLTYRWDTAKTLLADVDKALSHA